DGDLYFASDRSDFWNLYRWRGGPIEPLAPRAAEFGKPQWEFGMATYAFVGERLIACTYCERGTWRMATIDTATLAFTPLELPFSSISALRGGPGFVLFAAGSSTSPAAFVKLELASGRIEMLRRATELSLDEGYLSAAEAIEFPTEGGRTAHAF